MRVCEWRSTPGSRSVTVPRAGVRRWPAVPDVWEVIETVLGTCLRGEDAIAQAAAWGSLTSAQVRLALRYYGDFRDEIDARIASNRQEAAHQRQAWERAQEALG